MSPTIGLRARGVEVGHHRDLDAAAGAALDLFLVALQDVEDAAADGADAQQADLDGFHDGCHPHPLTREWRLR